MSAFISSGNYKIDALLFSSGARSNISVSYGTPSVITYSFKLPSDFSDSQNYLAFNDAQKAQARKAFDSIEQICGLRFVEELNNSRTATIGFNLDTEWALHHPGENSVGRGGPGSYNWYDADSNVLGSSGKVTLDADSDGMKTLTGWGFSAFLHEVGHALGLKHPGNYGEGEGPFLPTAEDNFASTIMSYLGREYKKPATEFHPYDIQALQYLFGKPVTSTTTFSTSPVISSVTDQVIGTAFNEVLDLPLISFGYARAGGQWFTYKDSTTFELACSNRIVDGGAGVDIGKVDAKFASSVIEKNQDGSLAIVSTVALDPAQLHATVSDPRGPSAYTWNLKANVTLKNIERLYFTDKAIAFDVGGNAGQAYRLYQASFDRKPDTGGLGYQMNALDSGLSLTQLAQNFINSPEFTKTFGSLDDSKYVAQLYQNVLHRAADEGGLAYHVKNLANGVSRAQTLVGFSESPENQAALIGVIQNGMEYTLVA